jgi:hypothetical protein
VTIDNRVGRKPCVEDIFMNQKQTSRPELPKYDGQTTYKRQLAYAALGIDPRDVQHLPFLRNEFRRIARIIRGVDKHDPPSPPAGLREDKNPLSVVKEHAGES